MAEMKKGEIGDPPWFKYDVAVERYGDLIGEIMKPWEKY